MDDPTTTPRWAAHRNLLAHQELPSLSKHVTDLFPLVPPPPLHTRSANESWDPQPSVEWSTPSSSPTKGAAHLTELFDKSLQLTSTSSPLRLQPNPSKRMLGAIDEDNNLKVDDSGIPPNRYNKENSPPPPTDKSPEPKRQALAAGLQRGYAQSARKKYDPYRDLDFEDVEKLAKPQVKRLKDVAHLCKYKALKDNMNLMGYLNRLL